MFEVVVEFDGVGRTACHAELAEGAGAEVVEILFELLFLCALGGVDHFRLNRDCTVGAGAFARAAGDAFVVAFGVVDKVEFGAESLGRMVGKTVLGIALRYFRCNEFFAGYFHAFYEACDAGAQC